MNSSNSPAAGSRPLRIDIVSDFVCPWCYLGKRRLEKALAERPQIQAEIHWRPFQLSPGMPREGKDRHEHFASIFGPERAVQIMQSMQETAAAEGLRFETKPGARSPNTLRAHALLQIASETPGIDVGGLAERLFAAHHTHSEDIGDLDVLARIATEAGMDGAAVREQLAAGTEEPAVQALVEEAQRIGVSGVPFFILDRRYALSGAQPPETLVEVFDRLLAESAD